MTGFVLRLPTNRPNIKVVYARQHKSSMLINRRPGVFNASMIGAFLLVVIVLALVAALYLDVTARAARRRT